MVTVVMPCYNEAEIIESCVREWYDEVVSKIPGADLLVVDDCSKDRSGEILERLSRELPGVRWTRPERNGGHGKALRFGFRHTSQAYVFQTDSDRQHKPSEFWDLWNARGEFDFVFGVRASRADGLFRKFITRTMRLANFLIWGVWVRDANCPFKLMKQQALTTVLAQVPLDSFIPMVMISILSRKMEFKIKELPVTHLARTGGTQSLKGILRWMRVSTVCFKQLLALRWNYRQNGAWRWGGVA